MHSVNVVLIPSLILYTLTLTNTSVHSVPQTLTNTYIHSVNVVHKSICIYTHITNTYIHFLNVVPQTTSKPGHPNPNP